MAKRKMLVQSKIREHKLLTMNTSGMVSAVPAGAGAVV